MTKSRSNGLSRLFNPPVFLIVLLQVRALRYAYMSIGFNAGGAVLVLLGSLVGSYFNIPVTQLPERHILSGHHVTFFGMRYVVPVVIDWPGTVVAVNVGGDLLAANGGQRLDEAERHLGILAF